MFSQNFFLNTSYFVPQEIPTPRDTGQGTQSPVSPHLQEVRPHPLTTPSLMASFPPPSVEVASVSMATLSCLSVSIVITPASSPYPLFPRQQEGAGSHLNWEVQPWPLNHQQQRAGRALAPCSHLHSLPGEGAGSAADGHGHVTACVQVAALYANPGAP